MGKKPVYHFIPEEETFEKRVVERLRNCREAILASAFFTNGAYQSLKDALEAALENKARITFLLGRFDLVTEPKAVVNLLGLAAKYPNRLKVFFDADFEFHYKLALVNTRMGQVVFIGSSNLTPKGLASVGEVNLEIVNNRGVFSQTRETLTRRLRFALPADEHIDEYRRHYNRAKKYRRQRRRWENRGRQKLTFKKQRSRLTWHEPEQRVFTWCKIEIYEQDKVLKKNIHRARNQAKSKEIDLPYQWVHLEKSDNRYYHEGEDFVVVDDLAHCFGFVVCTQKIRVLDSRNSRELIVFYRFRPGWKAQLSKGRYKYAANQLGLGRQRIVISSKLSERLKTYFRKRQKML
jgi:HKD family nuclease